MRTAIALIIMASAAWAQDRDLQRLKERLGLTDQQVEKIREINNAQRDGEEKLQKERDDKFKEVLTDEQKQKYEEYRRNPRGGGGGGGWGGGWIERMLVPQIDQLEKELGLTAEQKPKVKEIVDEFNTRVREGFEKAQQNGFQGMNWQEEMKKFQESVKEMGDKVKAHLTDEQKEKFDKLIANRFQFGNWMQGGRGQQGGGQGQGDRGPQRPSVDERVRRAMESLKMENAEEAAAVRDFVKKVVEAQYAMEDYERATKTPMDELLKKADASEDEIKAKIEEVRVGRRDKDKAVRDAQRALAEVVSYRQELELIKAGILR